MLPMTLRNLLPIRACSGYKDSYLTLLYAKRQGKSTFWILLQRPIDFYGFRAHPNKQQYIFLNHCQRWFFLSLNSETEWNVGQNIIYCKIVKIFHLDGCHVVWAKDCVQGQLRFLWIISTNLHWFSSSLLFHVHKQLERCD